MSEKDAAMFPLIASATLFGIYVVFQASMTEFGEDQEDVSFHVDEGKWRRTSHVKVFWFVKWPNKMSSIVKDFRTCD